MFRSNKKKITVNKSPHVFKKSKEHFSYQKSPLLFFTVFLFQHKVFFDKVFKQDSYLFENFECKVKTKVRFLLQFLFG